MPFETQPSPDTKPISSSLSKCSHNFPADLKEIPTWPFDFLVSL